MYIEDPIGRTSANVSLIQNDGGLFQKIWSCVQKGNVKIIMSVRLNILNEYSEDLQRYNLFSTEHMIDLSRGEFKMNNKERRELIALFCGRYQIQIVNTKSEENIHSKESIKQHKVKMSKATIQSIVKKDPAIGFPLCLKNYLGNKTNTSLGLNYFNIPTQAQLSEIEKLATSKHSSDRCQFTILVSVMFSGGRVNEVSLGIGNLREIGKDFNLAFIHQTMVVNALKKLRNKNLLYYIADEKCYKYSHDTILEAVFNVYTTLAPNKIELLINEADNRIIYEMVRTNNSHKNLEESLLVLDPEMESLLVERFLSELRRNNIRDVILHPAMTDEQFRSKFFHELKKEENRNLIENQNENENSLFMFACLFNKFPMVKFILEITQVSLSCVSDGLKLCLTLDNFETFHLLLPYLSPQEIEENFISSCDTGKVEIVKIFIQHQNKVSKEVLKDAFRISCLKGRTELVQLLLCNNQVMSNELIKYGFPAACQNDYLSTAEVLLNAASDLSEEDVKHWLTCLSSTSVGQHLLKRLFTAYASISAKTVSSIFYNLCLKRNIQGLQWILNETCLPDVTIIEVLTTIIRKKDVRLVNELSDIHIPRHELNTDGVKCRSKSMESYKSRQQHLTEKKIHRQRSVSDSDSVTETSSNLNQSPVNFQENNASPSSCNDATIAEVTRLVLSERSSIKIQHLRDFILNIFKYGQKDCFISVLNERSGVPEKDIVDGIKLASIGHYYDIIELVLQRGTLSPVAINTVLSDACDKGDKTIVTCILTKHDIAQATVIEKLEQAVHEKNYITVQAILEMKLYLPERVFSHLLTFLCKKRDHGLVKVFLDNRRSDIPSTIIQQCFLRACKDGCGAIIGQLMVQIDDLDVVSQGLLTACKCVKDDAVKLLLSRGINFPQTILTESLVAACLNYSFKTIETICSCTNISEKSVNQIGIICLHTRPSLFEFLSKTYIKNVSSFTAKTRVWSHHSLHESSLTTVLQEIGDSFSSFEHTNTDFSRKSLYILAIYGDKTTIRTVYRNALYMSHWMVSEILKYSCKENRHEIVQTILDLANDLPAECLHQGLLEAFEHNSIDSIKCILDSRKDLTECHLDVYFIDACRNSHTGCVTTVLACRKELRTEFIEQGLKVAVVNQNYDIAKLLLCHRTDTVSRCFEVLFHTACYNCNSSILALLLKHYTDTSIVKRCFLEACVFNMLSNVDVMLQRSTVPCDVVLQGFEAACRWNSTDICHKILEGNPNLDPRVIEKQLFILCLIGKARTIFAILNSRHNFTNFVYQKCCELGRPKIVKDILKGEALNQEEISDGITVACRYNQYGIIECILLSSNLQGDYIGKHLKEACQEGKLDLVECILRRRLDISLPIIEECFSVACENSYAEIAEAMLNCTSGMETVVKYCLLNACRKDDLNVLNVILKNVFLNDRIQTQALKEAFSIGSAKVVFNILINCQDMTPRNMHEGITWLDSNHEKSLTNLTMRVSDEINTKILVSVLKYACSQSSTRVIEIILSSNRTFTQGNIRQILLVACSKKNHIAFEAILKMQPQLADKHLFQILLRTVEERNVFMMKTVLKCRRDLFVKNDICVWQKAVISGDNEILKALLKHQDYASLKNISFALDTAFNNGNLEMYNTILHGSPDIVDKRTMRLIFNSFKLRNHTFVDAVLSSRKKFSKRQCAGMLVRAANQRKQDIVKTILQNNPDLTEDDIWNLNKTSRSTKRKAVGMLKSSLESERIVDINRFLLMFLMFINWVLPDFYGNKATVNRSKRKKRKRKTKKLKSTPIKNKV